MFSRHITGKVFLSSIFAFLAFAAFGAESDFWTDGKGTIRGYSGRDKAIVIPAQIGGIPVTAIGERAFIARGLTSIVIPNSVTSIGEGTFANNKLTSVTIPNSVTYIGYDAFSGNQLTSVTIPNSVTSIGRSAFGNAKVISKAEQQKRLKAETRENRLQQFKMESDDWEDTQLLRKYLDGTIFTVYWEELQEHNTELKRKVFLQSPDAAPYVKKLDGIQQYIRGTDIKKVVRLEKDKIYDDHDTSYLSNYDTSDGGFWLYGHIRGYSLASIAGVYCMRNNLTEGDSNRYGGVWILLKVPEKIALNIEGNKDLQITFAYRISVGSANYASFDAPYLVASTMKVIFSDGKKDIYTVNLF